MVSLDWVVSYNGRLRRLARQSRRYAPAKSHVLVREKQAGKIAIEHRGRKLDFHQIASQPARQPHRVLCPAA